MNFARLSAKENEQKVGKAKTESQEKQKFKIKKDSAKKSEYINITDNYHIQSTHPKQQQRFLYTFGDQIVNEQSLRLKFEARFSHNPTTTPQYIPTARASCKHTRPQQKSTERKSKKNSKNTVPCKSIVNELKLENVEISDNWNNILPNLKQIEEHAKRQASLYKEQTNKFMEYYESMIERVYDYCEQLIEKAKQIKESALKELNSFKNIVVEQIAQKEVEREQKIRKIQMMGDIYTSYGSLPSLPDKFELIDHTQFLPRLKQISFHSIQSSLILPILLKQFEKYRGDSKNECTNFLESTILAMLKISKVPTHHKQKPSDFGINTQSLNSIKGILEQMDE